MNLDLSSISNLITQNTQLGILICGFIALIESLAIIGSIIPGSVMMTLVGILLGRGLLPWYTTLITIFSGALVGDYISFWAGKYCKDFITSHRFVKPYTPWVQHGKAFIHKYGVFSILIGRFVGPMRSLVPMVAGILDMSSIKFSIAIFPTAFLWTIVYLTPGVILGSLASDASNILVFNLALKAFILSIIIAFWYAIPTLTKRFDIQISALGHQFSSIDVAHMIKAIIALLIASIFILSEISSAHWATTLNISAYRISQAASDISLVSLANFISDFYSPWVYVITIAPISYFLRKSKAISITFLILTSSIFLLTLLSKTFIPSIRPEMHDLSYGLPSGHVLLMPTLIFLMAQISSIHSNALAMLGHRIGIISLILVGISRILLSQHWLAQVLSSIFLSLFIAHSFAATKALWRDKVSTESLQSTLLLTLSTMCIASLTLPFFNATPSFYAIEPLNFDQQIPISRQGLIYGSNEPINIHINLHEEKALETLLALDWEQHTESSITQRLLKLMSQPYPYNATPLIQPRLNLHPPTLTLSKTIDQQTYILRLWKNSGQKQIMIGTISQDLEPKQLFALNNLTCSTSRYNVDDLPLYIKSIGSIEKISEQSNDQKWQPYCWNGSLLKIS
jgi:membrane protein DedA with SNARE-associated domain/membrane-associated phospholipid phosphatase